MHDIVNILVFACFGCVWVWQLVHPIGLLSFLPRFWQWSRFLTKLFSCASCVSGWCSILYFSFNNSSVFTVFQYAVLTMVTAKLIESKIYGKR